MALGSTRCLAACPSGQVVGLDNNCISCDVSCSTCTTSATNCVACKTGYIFASGTSGACISSCPAGKYSTGSACASCDPSCTLCFDAFSYTCTSCNFTGATRYYLGINSYTCYSSCPDGQFSNPSLNPSVCLLCSSICTRCDTIASNCTFCTYSGAHLVYRLNNMCYPTCPAKYFGLPNTSATTDNTCQPCTSGCATCFALGLNKCNSCESVATDNYYLGINSTTCYLSTCPSGQFIDDTNSPNVCVACHYSCAKCSVSYLNCTFCTQYGLDLLYLLNNICYRTCPDNYYAKNATSSSLSNTCELCTSGCTKCTNAGLNKCT